MLGKSLVSSYMIIGSLVTHHKMYRKHDYPANPTEVTFRIFSSTEGSIGVTPMTKNLSFRSIETVEWCIPNSSNVCLIDHINLGHSSGRKTANERGLLRHIAVVFQNCSTIESIRAEDVGMKLAGPVTVSTNQKLSKTSTTLGVLTVVCQDH